MSIIRQHRTVGTSLFYSDEAYYDNNGFSTQEAYYSGVEDDYDFYTHQLEGELSYESIEVDPSPVGNNYELKASFEYREPQRLHAFRGHVADRIDKDGHFCGEIWGPIPTTIDVLRRHRRQRPRMDYEAYLTARADALLIEAKAPLFITTPDSPPNIYATEAKPSTYHPEPWRALKEQIRLRLGMIDATKRPSPIPEEDLTFQAAQALRHSPRSR